MNPCASGHPYTFMVCRAKGNLDAHTQLWCVGPKANQSNACNASVARRRFTRPSMLYPTYVLWFAKKGVKKFVSRCHSLTLSIFLVIIDVLAGK